MSGQVKKQHTTNKWLPVTMVKSLEERGSLANVRMVDIPLEIMAVGAYSRVNSRCN